MKHIKLIALVGFLAMSAWSCTKDFEEINTDPNAIPEDGMDYNLLFSSAQVYHAGTDYNVWRNGLIYCATMIQHLASTQNYWNGDKYTFDASYNAAHWDRDFPNAVRDITMAMSKFQDNPEQQNAYHIARIMRVSIFQKMTDLYGDIPYSEAGLGYLDGQGYPAYDTQESIYQDMYKELKEASEALEANTTNTLTTADLIYGGDVAKWKKYAASFMVRLGLRLSKVDPETGKEWVQEALAAGVFANNEDNAMMQHQLNITDAANAYGKVLVYQDPNASRLSETFVNQLKNTNDPRLMYMATVAAAPQHAYGNANFDLGDTTASKQLGMPNGYDELGAETDISRAANWPGNINNYSIVNRYTYARLDAPTFLLTHAETQLLLAEAAHYGWISGEASTYYNEGVTAAIMQMNQLGASPALIEEQAQAYIAEHPFRADSALEMINTQYWIATFMDEYEAWTNYRRSGFPMLEEVNYFNNVTNGTIPRRFTYPTSEASINTESYNEAVARYENGDRMTSRMWWDVE
ncbi:SusD/RagB family nutrient-binding outer membrane lipoprotein [Olivibacter sp. SDN3]|uniref:SusD/RagB family nutrient-binding outer membrane lipoprotein n=1 Tax=Olivibacter sp. SDN3 TaxID=2764720 RepID=UPI0016510632|nr:SusD/RagB family nutrient-binding outer membrane lipoprotein [Olivibacter sp. SDN3]QNL51702.1 SusD/RagB family nutrient-binding outer membrane lipoprotein [Olivibacter sp. SDN3]